MKQIEVIGALSAAGLFRGPWTLDDLAYEPVSLAFILAAAEKWVNEVLPEECTEMRDIGGGARRKFPKYVPEAGDCDNQGKSFANYLSECEWAKACRTNQPLGNIAAGIVRFVPDGQPQGHLVVWCVDYDGKAHVFDPGLMDVRSLSQTEFQSIYGGETI